MPYSADLVAVAADLSTLAQRRLDGSGAAKALLLAAATIIDPIGDELAARGAAMLLDATREALKAWHDPVGVPDAGPDAVGGITSAPSVPRHDRVRPGRGDWRHRAPPGPRQQHGRAYPPISADRPRRFDRDRAARGNAASGTEPPALRDRLLSVIGNATGPDRQCHLTVAVLAARAGAAPERTRKELSAMVKSGMISRFPHANGQTATMIVARVPVVGSPPAARTLPTAPPLSHDTRSEGDMR